jgi:hypothetical protein
LWVKHILLVHAMFESWVKHILLVHAMSMGKAYPADSWGRKLWVTIMKINEGINTCLWDVNSWARMVQKIHEHWTLTNNDDSTVN